MASGASLTAHLPRPGSYEAQKVTLGPYPLANGTITSKEKQEILARTWCTVVNRGKTGSSGSRTFTVVGHPDWVNMASDMAVACIEKNGKDGGRRSAEEQAAHQAKQKEEATTFVYSPGLCSQGQVGGGPMLARPTSIIDDPPPFRI